jgi:hypothetical protein
MLDFMMYISWYKWFGTLIVYKTSFAVSMEVGMLLTFIKKKGDYVLLSPIAVFEYDIV